MEPFHIPELKRNYLAQPSWELIVRNARTTIGTTPEVANFHKECSNLSIYPSKIEGVLVQEPIRRLPQVNGQVAVVKQNVGGAPLCLSKSGDVGVCMFLKSCLDLRGTLHGTCAKSFFLASCCVLPNANTSSAAFGMTDGGKSTVKPNFFEEVIRKEAEGLGSGASRPSAGTTGSRTTKKWISKVTTTIYKGYTIPDWYKHKSTSRNPTPSLFSLSAYLTTKSSPATTKKSGQFGSPPVINNSAAWFRPNALTTQAPQRITGLSHSTPPLSTRWWGSQSTPIQPGSFEPSKPAGPGPVNAITPLPDVVLVMPDGVMSGSSNNQWNKNPNQQSTQWSQGGSMVSANTNGQGSYVFNINMQVETPNHSEQQGASFAVIKNSPNGADDAQLQTVKTKAPSAKNVTLTVATATNPIINGNVVPTPNDAMFVGTEVDNFLLWPNVGPPQQTAAPSTQGSPSLEQIFPVNLTATTVPSTTTTTTTTTPTTSTTTESTTPTTTPSTSTTISTTTTTPTTTTTTATTSTSTTTAPTTTTPTTTTTATSTTTTTPEETTTTTTEETTESQTTESSTMTEAPSTKIWTKWVPPARFTVPTRPTVETTESPTTTLATWTRWMPPERFTFPPTTTTAAPATPASVVDATGQITITLSEICGITPLLWKRIVGGTDAKLGQFPWQVSLRRIVGFISSHRCGATLVHPRWILTAAHCASDIPTEKMVVRIGEYDFSDSNAVYPHIDMRVAERIIHEKFNFLTFENDLALLRLAEPVNLAPHIIPACIAPYKNYTGSMGTISGWGRLSQGGALPPVLHSVQVPFISKSDCESWFDNGDRHQDVESCFICAGYKGGGKDACQGDSGGPIVQQVDGRWSLVGVISWGIGCADANLPGVSTLVPLFADWIQRRSNGDVYMPDFYLNKYGVPPSLSALSALAASSKLAKPQFAAL